MLTLIDLFFVNKDTGWIINSRKNGIFKTTNGGYNWQMQIDLDPTGSGLTRLSIPNAKTGYIATGFDKIIKPTDGGEHWGRQNAPSGSYNSIYFIDSLIGWAGGRTRIIHTSDGGGTVVRINNINSDIPKNYVLYQNYPNPFNPKTIINYQLSMFNYVNLKVYDLAGNEVKTLVNKKQDAGNYEIEFDGSELSSGVYFYKIEVYDERSNQVFTETKKMILIR